MRADVKVGVICLFVLVLSVVSYFAWNAGGGPKTDRARVQALNSDPGKPGSIGAPIPSPASTPVAEGSESAGTRNTYGVGILPPSMTAPATSGPTGSEVYTPRTSITGAVTESPASPPLGDLQLSGSTSRPASVATTMSSATTAPAVGSGRSVPGLSGGLRTSTAPSWAATGGLSSGIPGMPVFGSTTAPAATEYVVKHGDSLWSVAHANHVTMGALATANGLAANAQLKEKQKLKIPAVGASVSATTRTSATTASASSHATSRPGATSVVVKAGDSLRKIAKASYGDEAQWRKIYIANKATIGSDPDAVAVGMKLTIP